MINCNNISFKYNDFEALNNISFKLNDNQSMAIIGPSGCGKTTLLYCLAGLLKPEEGNIIINNDVLTDIRLETSVILQDHGLFPWKSVENNILLAQKVRKSIDHDRIDKILELLEIKDKKHAFPKQLSGGQKQRVGIARALATNPDLLLMDEPTSSLDAITKEKIQSLILKIYKHNPMNMIFVTHDIEEAVYLGKKICVMKDKEIKTIIDNPLFGQEKARTNMDFYEVCLQVRKVLENNEI